MVDSGHDGREQEEIGQRIETFSFAAILSLLVHEDGTAAFVVHLKPGSNRRGEPSPHDFLAVLGLPQSEGDCPFHGQLCHYAVIATIGDAVSGLRHSPVIPTIRRKFHAFVGDLHGLLRVYEQAIRIEKRIGYRLLFKNDYIRPSIYTAMELGLPIWIDALKSPRLRELEERETTIRHEIEDLRRFLPLTYERGVNLKETVIAALQILGLNVERPAIGSDVDVIAETDDGKRRFGFGVTAYQFNMKVNTGRIRQMKNYVREDPRAKGIIIANQMLGFSTGMGIHPRQLFYREIVDALAADSILLMTGIDLYGMVEDVREGSRTPEQLIADLSEQSGRWRYASP